MSVGLVLILELSQIVACKGANMPTYQFENQGFLVQNVIYLPNQGHAKCLKKKKRSFTNQSKETI